MILLDTHIWIRWILEDDPLPQSIIDAIELSDSEVVVSAISTWEVVLLEKRKRIELTVPVDQWLEEALIGSNVRSLPVTSEIAYLSGILLEHHKDPADRIIIATSIVNDTQLISLDTVFPLYSELQGRLISAS